VKYHFKTEQGIRLPDPGGGADRLAGVDSDYHNPRPSTRPIERGDHPQLDAQNADHCRLTRPRPIASTRFDLDQGFLAAPRTIR